VLLTRTRAVRKNSFKAVLILATTAQTAGAAAVAAAVPFHWPPCRFWA
jgi:hypothetical protein